MAGTHRIRRQLRRGSAKIGLDHGAVAITVRQELVTQEHAFLAKLCHDRLQFLVALCNLLGSGFKFLHPFLLLLSAFGGSYSVALQKFLSLLVFFFAHICRATLATTVRGAPGRRDVLVLLGR